MQPFVPENKEDTPHCFQRTEKDKAGCSGKLNKNLRRHKGCLFRKDQDRENKQICPQAIPLPFCLVQILLCSLNFGLSAFALQTCGVGSQAGSPKAPQPEEKQEEDVEIIGNPWVPESQQRTCQRP